MEGTEDSDCSSETMPLQDNQATPSLTEAPVVNSSSSSSSWFPWLRRAWALHFTISLLVILYGAKDNGGIYKYTPVEPSKVGPTCVMAFVNVYATSAEDPLAIICCDGNTDSLLCTNHNTNSKPLFLARSLSVFPQAWLIPLFPIFLRTFLAGTAYVLGRSPGEPPRATLLRIALYIGTLNFRGWILYALLDSLEEYIIPPVQSPCWYQDFLKHGPSCPSLAYDFSDHAVLYFAQILPIPLLEVLHSCQVPFWESSSQQSSSQQLSRLRQRTSIVCGILFLGYLYTITLMGVYKTTAYFHSAAEVIVGYLISLTVQLPYMYLQCFGDWETARLWLFGMRPSVRVNDRRED